MHAFGEYLGDDEFGGFVRNKMLSRRLLSQGSEAKINDKITGQWNAGTAPHLALTDTAALLPFAFMKTNGPRFLLPGSISSVIRSQLHYRLQC